MPQASKANPQNETQEPLLRVEHLCQYFGPNKAVDDVSFDIYKGEVFGLVGESGCGKTTTGRSIIKLYNITSGNIYFKGVRIGAGTRSYREELRKLKAPSPEGQTMSAEEKAEKIRDAIVNSEFYPESGLRFDMIDGFDDAVRAAAASAGEGDIVLLSPACASFDAFPNFAVRGDHFKKLVMELKDEDIGYQA